MLKLQETLQKSTAYLQDRGIELARRECEWIFCETLGLSRMDLYTQFDMPLDDDQANQLRALIQRRGKREPLAYVLGNQEFCGLSLDVSMDVLVPRPETEELVEQIVREHGEEPKRVADIGTGSGAIALAIKQQRSQWELHAVDVSEAALVLAKANATKHDLDIQFHAGYLHQPLDGTFDIVIANLPYVAEEEREHCDPEIAFEPQLALFAPDKGLALIKELITAFPVYKNDKTQLWLEIGFQQAQAVKDFANEQALRAEIFKDANDHQRMVKIYS